MEELLNSPNNSPPPPTVDASSTIAPVLSYAAGVDITTSIEADTPGLYQFMGGKRAESGFWLIEFSKMYPKIKKYFLKIL